jgi:hypothetical protein
VAEIDAGGRTSRAEAASSVGCKKPARRAWELGCVRRGVRRCPGGAYIGVGGEGKRLPTAMGINGHAALMGNQEGGGGEVKERKQPTDGGRVMAEHHCGLKKYFEGGGVRNSASNGRRP